MVKKIIHIADIHIPDNEKQRPYNEMLKDFITNLIKNECKGFKKEEIRIVVVGDIFHNKIKATNEAKMMFHTLFNYLNQIAQTIVIAGNHDMLENNKDRLDSITPTFEIKGAYPKITYADKALNYKSGYIVDDNIVWCVYSMFDNYARPNIDGLKETLGIENPRFIGLYHGDIVGAKTDTGRMSESGINTDDFIGCDCVMAGHIHKFQEIKKKGIPIVFAGSVFQQNVGENTTGHGYVVWNMEDMSYKHVDVENNYRMFKFKVDSYDDFSNDTETLLNL